MLWSIIEGLELNGLLDGYTHLYVVGSRAVTGMHSARSIPLVSSLCRLTGYIGSESFLRTVLRLVQRLREINPELMYFCDPVSLCLTHTVATQAMLSEACARGRAHGDLHQWRRR